jgi:pyruvate formate lyase activating enzyme
MQIKGIIKQSLLDFPSKIALVAFTGGCNFRCPFCQNADLVLRPAELVDIEGEEILALLERRRGFLDGLVLSGGEPTLQHDMHEFMAEVRALGYATKLDTNGYRPHVLESLIEARLVDFVAMDIKSAPGSYSEAAGVDVDLTLIRRSIMAILTSGLPHELRTTVVPGLVCPSDVNEIAEFVRGTERYVLQQYRAGQVIDPAYSSLDPYPSAILSEMASELTGMGVPTSVRGI